jgi:hypothetical protein
MALTFPRPIRGWDLRRNIVNFVGEDGGKPMFCAISMEALVDHFGAGKGGKHASLAAFDRWRLAIQQKASDKYAAQDHMSPILLRRIDFAQRE